MTTMATVTSTATLSNAIHSQQRTAENCVIIWVDDSIDPSTQYCQNILTQLHSIANNVNIFTQRDECIGFLSNADSMNVYLILGNTLASQIVLHIHDIPQLHDIYILCENKSQHEQWAKKWTKIKGVHTEIKPICEALQMTVKQCIQDSITMSFLTKNEVASSADLNRLDPSFMYTQIFKQIILEMEYDEKSFKDFILFWRNDFINDPIKNKVITEFEHDYCPSSSIKWYTRERFIFGMLNRALHMLEADIIINMGFLLRDLHKQLEELHRKQVGTYKRVPLYLYRGQGLSTKDFEKLKKSQGGLISFNNFLSTSQTSNVAHDYAETASEASNKVGIIFEMTIDPSVSSTPFAFIREFSGFPNEEEILFSMHAIFRIGAIEKIYDDKPIYEVKLTLTADDDQELRNLTECIRKEVADETGWKRLGLLLVKIGQFDRAEELYNILIQQTADEVEKAGYYNNRAYIKTQQGDYDKAIEYYEKSLQIFEKNLPPNHSDLATSYNNIGKVYKSMGQYSKAILFCEKAVEIFEKVLPPNLSFLATSYNNTGGVYMKIGDYRKALSLYEKALTIRQKTFPPNHPSLATSYDSIGSVHDNMGEYSKALSLHQKALEIRQKGLPPNHSDLATSYNAIGLIYQNMGEYSKALSFYEKALDIRQKTLPTNHPDLAISFNNIGSVYNNMQDGSKALSFHEKALEIFGKTRPPNLPDLAKSYNNIGLVYTNMGEYSKALSFYEKALKMFEKTLSSNHPSLATYYNNVGSVYNNMGEYSKALSFYEKALEIFEKTLLPNNSLFATYYNNIGLVYCKMGEYSKALSFHEKTVDIFEKTLPPNHPALGTSYNNIGLVYKKMEEYAKALSFYGKAHDIRQKTLSKNHPDLAISFDNIGLVHNSMGEYSKALSSYEKALDIRQKTLPPNHPSLATSYNNIGLVYNDTGEYSKALSSYEKALDIQQKTLPRNHTDLAISYKKIAEVYYIMGKYSKALSFYVGMYQPQNFWVLDSECSLGF